MPKLIDQLEALAAQQIAESPFHLPVGTLPAADAETPQTKPHAPRGANLPKFELDSVAPCVRLAHRDTREWTRAILQQRSEHTTPYWLTLFGKSGAGKTLLARHAHHTLKRAGYTCQLWRWGHAFSRLMNGEWELLGHLGRLPILFLDDIGAEYNESPRCKALNAAKLYDLLEDRLGKWTFLTSNLTPEQLGNTLDVRITSRLFRGNSRVIDLTTAEDYCYQQWKKENNTHHA